MRGTFTAFDLFAGCGGLSLGLEEAGIQVKWANENNHDAADTYRNSHPSTHLFEEDANLLYQRLVDGDKSLPKPGEIDLVAGGPPCQGFSGYNRHRSPEDPRNSLAETFLDIVSYLRPRYVLMENVPGLLSLAHGKTIRTLLGVLGELGYEACLGIIQAGNYGLPQNRWRIFIWAAKLGERIPSFPAPTHEFPRKTLFGATQFRSNVIRPPTEPLSLFWQLKPMITVEDAIGDLPEIDNGGGARELAYDMSPKSEYQRTHRKGSRRLYNHQTVELGDLMLERCRAVPKRAGAGWLDLPEHLKPKNLLRHGDNRYPNRFGRLHWKGTFNTIVHKPEPYWGSVIHPEQDRVLSARECARAQGFSDLVVFQGTLRSSYRQIGNAVPPPVAAALSRSLFDVEE